MSYWVDDRSLDLETRRLCREHLTPRLDSEGHTLWPLDELNPWLEPEGPAAPVGEDISLERAIQREVARRQAVHRQKGTTTARSTPSTRRSRWAHVPLAELFEQAGNVVYVKPKGQMETGHEPFHTSKSGRCVALDPARGLWWCRGCRQGGNALRLVRDLHGWDVPTARAWLTEHYGPPPERTPRSRPQHLVVELP